MRIKRYAIAEANSRIELAEEVELFIADGWQPIGGVEIAKTNKDGSFAYYQAVVEYDLVAVEMTE